MCRVHQPKQTNQTSQPNLYVGQDSRQKFASYRDRGCPKNVNNDKIRILAGHIHKIICFIDSQNWDKANKALNDLDLAASCGIRIDSPFKICETTDEAITYSLRRAFWSRNKMKLLLPQVAIGHKGMPFSKWVYPEEMPQLAIRFFPIWLEEWIHAFQHFIAGPVSDETIAFKKSECFNTSWDVNEIDIYAIYKDLGWDKKLLKELKSRYDERIAFAAYVDNRKNDHDCILRVFFNSFIC